MYAAHMGKVKTAAGVGAVAAGTVGALKAQDVVEKKAAGAYNARHPYPANMSPQQAQNAARLKTVTPFNVPKGTVLPTKGPLAHHGPFKTIQHQRRITH
jgi:hypothetical protein